jgi:hypothetical protein
MKRRWLTDWPWETVVTINAGLCKEKNALHPVVVVQRRSCATKPPMNPDIVKFLDQGGVLAFPLRGNPFETRFLRNMFFAQQEDLALLHFIPRNHFLTLLRTSQIMFRRLDAFTDDDREGCMPSANVAHQGEMISAIYSGLNIQVNLGEKAASLEVKRQFSYIHCWYCGDTPTNNMWEKYSNDGTGVCIRSSTTQILQSLQVPDSLSLHCGRPTYSDDATAIPVVHSSAPAFRKQPKFNDECEFRLLVIDKNPVDESGVVVRGPEMRPVPVSLSALISEVIIGPKCASDDGAAIEAGCEAHLPGVPVTRA